MTEQNTSAVRYDRDADGIVVLTLDDPTSSANTMSELYQRSMGEAVDRLEAERDSDLGVTGVVVTSAKRTFFAGGDLKRMVESTPEDAPEVFAMIREVYGALGRPRGAPLATWREAVHPLSAGAMEDRFRGRWQSWIEPFPRNSEVPGIGSALNRSRAFAVSRR